MTRMDNMEDDKIREITAQVTGGSMMASTTRIAVPSARPGGLSASSEQHFGHCEFFTLVDVVQGKVVNVTAIHNVPHVQGGCMAPVNLLKENGVDVLLVGGIGMRPLMGFGQVGIKVYSGAMGTVQSAVEDFISGRLRPTTENDVCGHQR